MAGQLAQWHKKYASQGFVLIDVDDGSKDKDFEAFKKHVQEKKIEYATLWDKGGKTTKAYGIMAFPSQYLIGVDGTVIWEGNCSREKAKVEALIEAELAKVKKP
jgi:hypothetical protein